MMRRGVVHFGLLAALAAASWATPAQAQDGDSAGSWRLEARALDYSTMLQSQHGAQMGKLTEVPLARVPVHVLVRAPGLESETRKTQTDLVGRFAIEGDVPPPGATIEFFVPGADGDQARPGYYGRPWAVDDGDVPEAIQFYEVATEPPRGLMIANAINIVSAVDRDETTKVVQLRHTVMLNNRDFQVWLGDLGRGDYSTFGIRIPAGFELRNVTVDNAAVDATDIGGGGHGGGERWMWRQPIFPSFERGTIFQAMFVAPYEDGREYDISWHNELPVMQYALNIQQGLFTYLPPATAKDGIELTDGGINQAMGNVKIVTHAYGVQQVPPHQTLSARFIAGTPFPWKAVIWTGSIVLLAVGAAVLGLVAAKPRQDHDEAVAQAKKRVKVPPTPEGREHELEMLDRRLRRGEITSVEYDVRKAAIQKAGQPIAGVPRRGPPTPAKKKAIPAGLTADLDAIAARVDDADADQLRGDVRALLDAVRKLLGER